MKRFLFIVPAVLALTCVAAPAMATEPEPTAEPTKYAVGLYCYDKLTDAPAAWENSGVQTLVAVKDGVEGWSEAEKRELCAAPVDACEPRLAATQEDWVSFVGEFTFPEHITYPTDNIGWPPIYKAAHTDLPQTVIDCTVVVPPVVPPTEPLPPVADVPSTLALTGAEYDTPTFAALALILLGALLAMYRRWFRKA